MHCSKKDCWPYPVLLGHRAGGTVAAENTMVAFHAAVKYGFRAIETDAMLSADGVLVLSHDEELGRAIRGQGRVCELSYDTLCSLDAGINFGQQFQGERIVRLDEAIDFCREHHLFMNIEIKPAQGFEVQTAEAVAQMVYEKYADSDEKPLISSFSKISLASAKRMHPELSYALLLENFEPDWLTVARELGVCTVHPDWQFTDENFVKVAHEAGLGVMCYTVDDVDCARALVATGVDAICTNRLDIFTEAARQNTLQMI